MRRGVLAGLAMMATASAHADPPGPVPVIEEQVQTHYYEIHGRDARALHAALESRTHGRGVGETGIRIEFEFAARQSAHGCQLTELGVRLDMVVIYPRWMNADDASPELRRRWDRFIAALEVHEEGHAQLAREGAGEIARRLAESAPAPDCRTLQENLSRRYDVMRAALDGRQRAYDRETGAGRFQGAHLRFSD